MNETVNQLRAVSADPVRLDLLEALRDAGGPLSTVEIEALVPAARGGIETHLLRLAESGWIDRLEGQGRSATWQTSSTGVTWSEAESADPDVALAIDELYWVAQQRRINRIRAFDAQRQDGVWAGPWVDAAIGFDSLVHLSAQDLAEFEEDFRALVTRFRGRGRQVQAGQAGPEGGVERVFLTLAAFPVRLGD